MIQTLSQAQSPYLHMEFLVQEWANRYVFVENMAQCAHYDTYMVDAWRAAISPLSEIQENALHQFKSIRDPYGPKSIFDEAFFIQQIPWEHLATKVPNEEIKKIQEIFLLLEPSFVELYKEELPLLEEKKIQLEHFFSLDEHTGEILNILEALFGLHKPKRDLYVYLLMGDKGGSANIKSNAIALHVSRMANIHRAAGVIWHEMIHASFEGESGWRRRLLKFFEEKEQGMFLFSIVKEAIVSSLFPNGVLGQKFYNRPKSRLHYGVPEEFDTELIDYMKTYVDAKKPLDDELIAYFTATLEKCIKYPFPE